MKLNETIKKRVRNKEYIVRLSFTSEQKERVNAEAKKNFLPVTQFCRMTVLKATSLPPLVEKDLFEENKKIYSEIVQTLREDKNKNNSKRR